MALMMKKEKAEKVKPKPRLCKLKETNCQEAFREKVTRILGGEDGLPDRSTHFKGMCWLYSIQFQYLIELNITNT